MSCSTRRPSRPDVSGAAGFSPAGGGEHLGGDHADRAPVVVHHSVVHPGRDQDRLELDRSRQVPVAPVLVGLPRRQPSEPGGLARGDPHDRHVGAVEGRLVPLAVGRILDHLRENDVLVPPSLQVRGDHREMLEEDLLGEGVALGPRPHPAEDVGVEPSVRHLPLAEQVGRGVGHRRLAHADGAVHHQHAHPGGRHEPPAVADGRRHIRVRAEVRDPSEAAAAVQPEAIRLYRSGGFRPTATFGPYTDVPTSICYGRWLVPDAGMRVLVVNGTVGAGKTVVADAAADLLREREVPHAWLDADVFRRVWPRPEGDPFAQQVLFEHLAVIAPNLQARGYRHVVLAEVVEDAADRERYEAAFDGADVAIVRVTASEATRLARVAARETDEHWRDWHLARTVELEAILVAAGVDDAVVDNDRRPVRVVAAEVLAAAGW